MVRVLSQVTTLLLAVAILLVGHGLQLTLLPVHAEALGWTTRAIGISGSAYFLGFVAGCMVVPSIVASVGHVRTFMVMGAVATIALLGAGVFVNLGAWMIFRFMSGLALSGLYMVIESWLSDASPANARGSVLAVYAMICLLGMAAGQSLLGLASPLDMRLFILGAGLLCLAIIPIGLTRIEMPHPLPSLRFTPRILLRTCRVAVGAALISGLVTGAFWALGPIVAQAFGLSGAQVGTAMSVGLIGGALSQLPMGRLSDRYDRRLIIGGTLAAGAAVALAGFLFASSSTLVLFAVMFLLGATTLPIYALCIAHASDNSDLPLVEVASGVLITHSAGSIVGPVVVAMLIERFGARSYFAVILAGLALGAVWTFYRVLAVERARDGDTHGTMLPGTTQVVAGLSGDESPDPATGARRRDADWLPW